MKTKKSIKAIDGLIDKYKKDQKMFEALMRVRWLLKAMGVIVALFVGLGVTAQTGNKITLTLTAGGADTTSLSNRINLKVDSLTRTTDSICYWVNGTKSCLLSPQLDTTSLSDRINLKLDSLTFAAAILDYIKLIDFKFVNLLDVDTAGKEDGDFVRYRAADSSYYLSGFPAVFELDSTDNGLVASGYAGIVPADSSFMLKRWTDSIYAAKATTIQISGGVGISATGGTQSLSANRSWTIAADTGRATTQLVTGGGLTKVADSLGALITGGGGGAPGGSSGQVQYNNAGTFAGAANVEIQDNVLRLDEVTSTPTPSAGGMKIYSKDVNGIPMMFVKDDTGTEQALQSSLMFGKMPVWVSYASSTTAPIAFGATVATAATMGTANPVTTNPWLMYQRKTYTTSTTAGNASGIRQSYTQFGNSVGGFFAHFKFGQTIALDGEQKFVGMCTSTGALAGDASALVHMIGMGVDAGDVGGNWYLMHNDGAGIATKIDLGANAARNTTDGYELNIYIAANSSTYYVYIKNLATGVDVYNGTITTNIPGATNLMAWKAECRNGAVAAATNLHMAQVFIQPL